MDGYIKIGKTSGSSPKDVQDRMKTLDSTGVPRGFTCEYAAVVKDYAEVERAFHTAFGDSRVRANREFFEGISPHRVRAVLRLLEIKDATPRTTREGASSEEPPKGDTPPRRPNFRFSMVGIPEGASLQWTDDPSVECTVSENNRVLYEGQKYSLSGLAQKLRGGNFPLAGPMYWLYEEETLAERRDATNRSLTAMKDRLQAF